MVWYLGHIVPKNKSINIGIVNQIFETPNLKFSSALHTYGRCQNVKFHSVRFGLFPTSQKPFGNMNCILIPHIYSSTENVFVYLWVFFQHMGQNQEVEDVMGHGFLLPCVEHVNVVLNFVYGWLHMSLGCVCTYVCLYVYVYVYVYVYAFLALCVKYMHVFSSPCPGLYELLAALPSQLNPYVSRPEDSTFLLDMFWGEKPPLAGQGNFIILNSFR